MRFLVTLLVALAMAIPVVSAEWPMYRFDETHQGYDSFNSDFAPFTVEWWANRSIPATIKGSPIVVADPTTNSARVFIGAWDNYLYAFDSESGSELWKVDTKSKISGTPAASETTVYVVNEGGTLSAYNSRTGVLERSVSVGATFGSPVVHERRVFIGSNAGTVSAYEGDTLSQIWSFTLAGTHVLKDSGDKVTTPTGQVEGSPAVFNGQVLFGSTNQFFYSLDEQGRGDKKTDVNWVFKATGSIRSSPVVDTDNQRVIFGAQNGYIYSVDITQTGEWLNATSDDFVWAEQEFQNEDQPTQIQSSAAIVDKVVIHGANNGKVYARDIEDGEILWEYQTGGQVVSSPAAANGRVLIGSSDRTIYMFGIDDANSDGVGDVVWSRTAPAAIESSPAIFGAQGFWTSTDGSLFSWGGSKPQRADLAVESVSGSLQATVSSNIRATIKNVGALSAPATQVQFFAGATLLGTSDLAALEPGASKTISQAYTASGTSAVSIKVVVDPSNAVRETDEGNNQKIQSITPGKAPSTASATGSSAAAPAPEVGLLAAAMLGTVLVLGRRRR